MKFTTSGTRTRTITTVIIERVSGGVDITKAEVIKATQCGSVIDGDSTGWYGYVGEALHCGASHTIKGESIEQLSTTTTEQFEWQEEPEVEWV